MDFFQMESPFLDGAFSTSMVCDRPKSQETPQGRPTVFIVDGDGAASESLAALVTREGWHQETFRSGEEFLAHPVEPTLGCLILDVSLPGLSGLELQRRASAIYPHIPIIFLSAKGDVRTTVEAMKAGAVGFLTKPFLDNELLSAIREAFERSRMIVSKKAEKQALQRCYGSLSLRQRQVMALVSSGMINKQIAAELGISEITVKAHRGQMMQKMQANSLADLVKMAGRLGLAKGRQAMKLREQPGHASYPGSQLTQSYALVV
jgi:FixJ family two-component response regulator